MDGQLYVWARRQEFQRELARRALVSEAKALRAQGNGERRGIMFGIRRHLRAMTPTKQEDLRQEPTVSDPPAVAKESGNGRAWRWRVEPGMEETFQDLLGWMLPSQRGAEVETASTPPQPSAPVTAEQLTAPQPTALEAGERRHASEFRPLPA